MQYFYKIRPNVPTGNKGLIAYISDRGGHFDIWLYNPKNNMNTRLTQQLGDSLTRPEWSRDGKYIAFIGKGRFVYVIQVSNGAIARIDQIGDESLVQLAWSPTSNALAYTNNGQIILYNIVNHQSQRISQPGVSDVQWFPSGVDLLFQALDVTGNSQLFRIRTDGTRKQQITRNTSGPLQNVRLSPDGMFALYTSPGASISIIYTVEISTGNVFEVKGGPLAKNYYPVWSPNSRFIAYSATAFDERGYYSQIRTVGRRGEQDRIWAISSCFATPVTWSTNGRKLAYLSGCNQQEFANELWVIDLLHPVPIRLVEGQRILFLQWSPSRVINYPHRIYSNPVYKVRFHYPAHWQRVNDERYEGEDGFFQISAIAAGESIDEVCHNEAFHELMPYGSTPQIRKTNIQNQQACLIFPSADQPAEMNTQSALIVRYPTPIQIQETQYNYFILWADRQHIQQIASTVTL